MHQHLKDSINSYSGSDVIHTVQILSRQTQLQCSNIKSCASNVNAQTTWCSAVSSGSL